MNTNLKQQIDDLKQEQEKLIQLLKEKHSDIYKWLKDNKIDPRSLGIYAKNIAVAVLITYGALTTTSGQSMQNYSLQKERDALTINSERLKESKSEDDQRAAKVWNEYGDEILETSTKYDLDPKIIFATIMSESGGNTKSVRYEPSINDASYGLGQILYGTAVLIGYNGTPAQLYDPATNIDLIARYHKRNIEVYGNLNLAEIATAYNTGTPNNIPTYGYVTKFTKWFNVVSDLTQT